MDRPALVGADGEEGLADHGPEGLLLDLQGVLVFHGGQLGEVLGIDAHEVELAHAAGDVNLQLLLLENQGVVGHFPNDLAKETGGKDHGTDLRHVGLDGGADAGLLVVAGDEHGAGSLGLQQQAFQGGDGALGRDCPGSGEDGGLQQGLFTAEFHGKTSKRSKLGKSWPLSAK